MMRDPKIRRIVCRAVAYGLRRSNPELATIIGEARNEQSVSSSSGRSAQQQSTQDYGAASQSTAVAVRPTVHDIWQQGAG